MLTQTNLYNKIITEITKAEAPIVFTGGYILPFVVQKEKMIAYPYRTSADLDMDWTKENPTMHELVNFFTDLMLKIDENLRVAVVCSFDDHTAARFSILYKNEVFGQIDICPKPEVATKRYQLMDFDIPCHTPEHLTVIKTYAVSTDKLRRHPIDLIDLYALSATKNFSTDSFWDIFDKKGLTMGSWEAYDEASSELQTTYEAIDTAYLKPEWSSCKQRVDRFIEPFKSGSRETQVWNGFMWERSDV